MTNLKAAAPLLEALGISQEFAEENDHILEDPVVKAFVAKEITLKQALWIEHYVSNGMKAEAAVKSAGYEVQAYEFVRARARQLRTNPKIRRIISAKVNEIGMSSQEVIAQLVDVAMSSMGDFLTETADGEVKFDIKKARDRSKMHLVKKVRVDERGRVTLEMRDQDLALATLAKFHGLFEKDNLQKLSPEAAVIASMSPAERKEALKELRDSLTWDESEFEG